MSPYLHAAAVRGDLTPFLLLVKNGDFPPVFDHMNTALHVHLASPNNRSIEFVKFLVDNYLELMFATNVDGDSPLHLAARNRQSEIVNLLMFSAANIGGALRILHIRNGEGDTALHEAVRNNGVLDVCLLLDCPDDISDLLYAANEWGESPVYIAASKGYHAITNKLIERHQKRDKNPGGDISSLIEAAMSGDSETLKRILEKHPKLLMERDGNGWTPLHYAATANDRAKEVVEVMLKANKPAAFIVDGNERTALHMAACRGNALIMKAIMFSCPDCILLTDNKGWNVLHYAVISESDEALKTVLESSWLPHLIKSRDTQGNMPMHLLAVSRDYFPAFLDVEYLKNLLRFELPDTVTGFSSLPTFRRKLLDDLRYTKDEVLKWMSQVGEAPSMMNQKISLNHFLIERKKSEEDMAERLDRAKEYHLVVAALVATVTFAAAFTIPGGFISDGSDTPKNGTPRKGTPILSKNTAFKAFLICNSLAMALSTSSVFAYIILAILQNKKRYDWLMRSALRFIILAMAAMVLAFVTGSYAVLCDSLVYAVLVCGISLCFFVFVIYVTIKIIRDSLTRRDEDGPMHISLLRIWRRSPFHF